MSATALHSPQAWLCDINVMPTNLPDGTALVDRIFELLDSQMYSSWCFLDKHILSLHNSCTVAQTALNGRFRESSSTPPLRAVQQPVTGDFVTEKPVCQVVPREMVMEAASESADNRVENNEQAQERESERQRCK